MNFRFCRDSGGQVGDPFAEEDTVEAVLLGSVGLGVPVPRVVGQVLGHGRIGVERYLWHVKGTGAVLGQGQQPCSDAPALGSGQYGHVLQQQIAGPGEEDDEPGHLAVHRRHPGLAAADRSGVVGRHRGGWPADSGHIVLVGRHRDLGQGRCVGLGRETDGDHGKRIGSHAYPLLPHTARARPSGLGLRRHRPHVRLGGGDQGTHAGISRRTASAEPMNSITPSDGQGQRERAPTRYGRLLTESALQTHLGARIAYLVLPPGVFDPG